MIRDKLVCVDANLSKDERDQLLAPINHFRQLLNSISDQAEDDVFDEPPATSTITDAIQSTINELAKSNHMLIDNVQSKAQLLLQLCDAYSKASSSSTAAFSRVSVTEGDEEGKHHT